MLNVKQFGLQRTKKRKINNMPKFDENTGFKMPGVGSKEIDSPSNFRDEHHVDKMGYCDNTPDDMLPEGSSPLKARYTSSGYLKDLDVITLPRVKKKDTPPPSSSKKPPPPEKKSKGVIMGVNANYDFGKIKDSTGISISSKTPGKTTTTPGSKKGGTGVSYADKFKTLSKAEQKKFGTVENFQKAGEEWWKKQNATTKTTPGKSSSISGKTIL